MAGVARGVLEHRVLEAKKGLELGAILEIARVRSAKGKIACWSAERQSQKGSERGAPMSKKGGARSAVYPWPPPTYLKRMNSSRGISLKVSTTQYSI